MRKGGREKKGRKEGREVGRKKGREGGREEERKAKAKGGVYLKRDRERKTGQGLGRER